MDFSISDYLFPDPVNTWDNYDKAQRSSMLQERIQVIAFCVLFSASFFAFAGAQQMIKIAKARFLSVSPNPYEKLIAIGLITHIFVALLGFSPNNKGGHKANLISLIISSGSTLGTVAYTASLAKRIYPHPSLSFPVNLTVTALSLLAFSWMSFYLAARHTRGLTERRFAELSIDRIKEVMALNPAKPRLCSHIEKITSKEDLTHIWILSERMQANEILDLMLFAYQLNRILHFSSQNRSRNKTVYESVIQRDIQHAVDSEGFHGDMRETFLLSVAYLIKLREQNPAPLKNEFINEQLKAWSRGWYIDGGTFYQTKPSLYLNGQIPVIREYIKELGDISESKTRLEGCFGSIQSVHLDLKDMWQ